MTLFLQISDMYEKVEYNCGICAGSKAVTFAQAPVSVAATPGAGSVQETPLMFSRSSSLGSLPDCSHDDQGSVLSEFRYLQKSLVHPSHSLC
jgi:hypothetical protein